MPCAPARHVTAPAAMGARLSGETYSMYELNEAAAAAAAAAAEAEADTVQQSV